MDPRNATFKVRRLLNSLNQVGLQPNQAKREAALFPWQPTRRHRLLSRGHEASVLLTSTA